MTSGRPPAGGALSSSRPDARRLARARPIRRRFRIRPHPAVPADAIAQAAEILAGAERPIILAGGGALWSGAADAIENLAARLDAPVVTTLNGKGLLDERHPLSLGHARSARGRRVLPHADAMLAVGCRFTEVMTDWRRMHGSRELDPDRPRPRARSA